MATQLAQTFEAPAGDEQQQDVAAEPVARDYEAEARQHGWTPKEEFKGDPTRWADAESFVKRADEVMPLLKKKTDAQDRRIKELERAIKDAATHYGKLEERTYARAVEDLKKRQEAAVEIGDVEAHRAISKEIDDLRSDIPNAPSPDLALEAKEAEIDWRERNSWYDKPGLARDYADLMVQKHMAKTKEMAPADFFEFIGEEVLKRYPDAGAAKPARTAINPVEGAGNRRPSGQKGWGDMSPEEARLGRAMASRLIKSNFIKDEAEYLRTYDWNKK